VVFQQVVRDSISMAALSLSVLTRLLHHEKKTSPHAYVTDLGLAVTFLGGWVRQKRGGAASNQSCAPESATE